MLLLLEGASIDGGKFTFELSDVTRNLLHSFIIIQAFNFTSATYINFVQLRTSRSKNDPHDTATLYSGANKWIQMKRKIFAFCHVVTYILVPIATIICYFSYINGKYLEATGCYWFMA